MDTAGIVWVWHTGNLIASALGTQAVPGYQVGHAAPSAGSSILEVVTAAYGSDPIWHPSLEAICRRMSHRINESLGHPDCVYLVAIHAQSVVAVSGVAIQHWTGQNLLTGICVGPAHQRRGVGTMLLAESLRWLHSRGLATATVYTEEGSLADRKVYPMFGSMREAGVIYPGALPEDRAIEAAP